MSASRIEGGAVDTGSYDVCEEPTMSPAAPEGEARTAEPEKDHVEEYVVSADSSASKFWGKSDMPDPAKPAAAPHGDAHAEASADKPAHASEAKAPSKSEHAPEAAHADTSKAADPSKPKDTRPDHAHHTKANPLKTLEVANLTVYDTGPKEGSISGKKQLIGDAENGVNGQLGYGEGRVRVGFSQNTDGSRSLEAKAHGKASAGRLEGQAQSNVNLTNNGSGLATPKVKGSLDFITVEGEMGAGVAQDQSGNPLGSIGYRAQAAVVSGRGDVTVDVMVDGEKLGTYGVGVEGSAGAVGVTMKVEVGQDNKGNVIFNTQDGWAAGIGLTGHFVSETDPKVAAKIVAKDMAHPLMLSHTGSAAMAVEAGVMHQLGASMEKTAADARFHGDPALAHFEQAGADALHMGENLAAFTQDVFSAVNTVAEAPLNAWADFLHSEFDPKK